MIDPNLTLRKLEIFLTFMKTQNIGQAAQELQMSAVSVHRALHSLEESLRCPLFARKGRNLLATPAAMTLATYASDTVRLLEQAIDATRNVAGFGSGRLKLGTLYSLTANFIPLLITGLKKRRPEIQIDLSMNSNQRLLSDLMDGKLDAILISSPHESFKQDTLQVLPLFEDSLYLATSQKAKKAIKPPVHLSDLKNEKFVALSNDFATGQGFTAAFKEAGFKPDVVTYLNDIFSLMNLVQAGVGYSLVPKRLKKVFEKNICFFELGKKYQKSQQISLFFHKNKEKDPDILALVAEARIIIKEKLNEAF